MIARRIVRFCFALKGGDKASIAVLQQQLNKGVMAAPQGKSRVQCVEQLIGRHTQSLTELICQGTPEPIRNNNEKHSIIYI